MAFWQRVPLLAWCVVGAVALVLIMVLTAFALFPNDGTVTPQTGANLRKYLLQYMKAHDDPQGRAAVEKFAEDIVGGKSNLNALVPELSALSR